MGTIAGTLLAIAGPAIVGWLLVRCVWPEGPSGVHLALGTGLGTALVGTIYFLMLSLTNSSLISIVFSEFFLIASIVLFPWRVPRTRLPKESTDKKGLLAPLILMVLSAGVFFLFLDLNLHGQWEALAMWNLKAKFIAFGETPLSKIVDPALVETHTDYPLLLPVMVARGWQYIGHASSAMPMALAALFTTCTFFLLVQILKIIANPQQAYMAGAVLAATPFFLELGSYQYADNVIGFLVTAAVGIYCLHDALGQKGWRLPFLAGLAAGMALCTKSEGLLFLLALFGTRLLLVLWRRTWRSALQEAWGSLLGLLPGVITLMSFKMWPALPDPLSSQVTLGTLMTRLPMLSHHWGIIKGMTVELVSFGRWLLLPLPFLLLHVLMVRKEISLKNGNAPWLTAAMAISSLLIGSYFVYLLTPYSLAWHIETSFSRLLIQVWPSALLLYATVVTPQPRRID